MVQGLVDFFNLVGDFVAHASVLFIVGFNLCFETILHFDEAGQGGKFQNGVFFLFNFFNGVVDILLSCFEGVAFGCFLGFFRLIEN